ncbi:MAG: DNA polymerase/3'-5' exonuclease PolX [Caldilineaceae bacterium SB0668_bin_21]|nr:DNA polymerase/3'-5' exonuclease PolX [Caldilineaceae bacterium SB0668_bin_21]MYC20032.1 DNA polymerase/3'-5' exonuclease PolX [Caldilineaceae bacterium SB0662_bin_25]
MSNKQVAGVFKATGDLLQILGESRFVVMAYTNAARTIDGLEQDINEIASAGALRDLPRVGEAIAEKIQTLLDTGTLPYYDALAEQVPAGVVAMLQVPDVGPKTVQRLWRELDITSVDALKKSAEEGRLRRLKGFGAKTEKRILKSIELLSRRSDDRTPIGSSLPLAESLLTGLRAENGGGAVERISIVGSLRRWRETTGEVKLLAVSSSPEQTLNLFKGLPQVAEVVQSEPDAVTVSLVDGPHAALRLVEGESWGTALLLATGSQGHLTAVEEIAQAIGWQIDESGLTAIDANAGTANGSLGRADGHDGIRVFDCEEALYDFIGLQCIPPELREGDGEIEAASGRQLPNLIAGKEILGEVHGHTTWSDGKSSVAEMAEAARSRGYRYWAVTDHSVGLGVTRGVDAEALLEQRREIDAVNQNYSALGIDFRLIQGTEVEVLGDGELGLSDEVLASLDVVVASIHSGLRQDRQRITERCLKAVHNPYVDILGHPTGRLLGRRAPSDLDLDQVLMACAETGTAVEINANPERLDLSADHARLAVGQGCTLVINSDAHSIEQLELMRYGVHTARRAWLRTEDILNARPLDELLALLKRNKTGRGPK